jgi:hypothetical protein
MYSERLGNYQVDNLINYEAGPLYIEISGWDEYITITSTDRWDFLLPQILEIAKIAWDLEDDQIVIEKCKIRIKYNFKNLKLYISHAILFL